MATTHPREINMLSASRPSSAVTAGKNTRVRQTPPGESRVGRRPASEDQPCDAAAPVHDEAIIRANDVTRCAIYYLHPLLAGLPSTWHSHFARCRKMGFDSVLIAPPFLPGVGGDIFLTRDHQLLHPALGTRTQPRSLRRLSSMRSRRACV